MATTTASLTITSGDLVGDALSLSTSSTLFKAGTSNGIDQTTGIATVYLTAVTPIDIFPVIMDNTDVASPFQNKTHWVYICNNSVDETEYVTITICSQVIGRLYAGDFLWMPWSQQEDGNAADIHADIELTPSVDTGMFIDWGMFHEGIQYPTCDTTQQA